MQIKSTMGFHHIPLECLKLKKLTIPNVDENVEQLELSYTASGNIKEYNHFGKQFGNLLKN